MWLMKNTLIEELAQNPRKWTITGVGGFIGSNLLEALLNLNQQVVGLDNFSTGHKKNLDQVKKAVSGDQWNNFEFIQGDIRSKKDCDKSCKNTDFVLHQAALGSVPRSIKDPIKTNENNLDGFLNMISSSYENEVTSFTYASSSSVYGDHSDLPKIEEYIGNQLSPYAVTKYSNELYASVFAKTYDFKAIGLRYFNVFGKRQDPNGPYSAVIPKWINAMMNQKTIEIYGDGETSRDFCYIDNVIQMNILASLAHDSFKDQIYNVAVGERTSLNDLFSYIRECLANLAIDYDLKPEYKDFREGDVKHSLADITKASQFLGYQPEFKFEDGLRKTIDWFLENKA